MSDKNLKPHLHKVLLRLLDKNGKEKEKDLYFTTHTTVPILQLKYFQMKGFRVPSELSDENVFKQIKESRYSKLTYVPPDPFYPRFTKHGNNVESLRKFFSEYQAEGLCNFYNYVQGLFLESSGSYSDALDKYINGSMKLEMFSMLKLAKIFLDPHLADSFEIERDINRALEILVKCYAVNGLFDSFISGEESIHGVYILYLYCDCFPEIYEQASSMFSKFPILNLLLNFNFHDPSLFDKFKNIEQNLKYYPLILGDLLHPFFFGGTIMNLDIEKIRDYYYKASRQNSKPEKINESKMIKNAKRESILRDAIVCKKNLEEICNLAESGNSPGNLEKEWEEKNLKQSNLGSQTDYLKRVVAEGVLADKESKVKILDYDYLRFSLDELIDYETQREHIFIPTLQSLKNIEVLTLINPDPELLSFYFQLLYLRAKHADATEENLVVELKNTSNHIISHEKKFKFNEQAFCLEKGIGSKSDVISAINFYRRYTYECSDKYDMFYFTKRISRILLKNFKKGKELSETFEINSLILLFQSIQEEFLATETLENEFTFSCSFGVFKKLFMLCKMQGQSLSMIQFICNHYLLKGLEEKKFRRKDENLLLYKIKNFLIKKEAKSKGKMKKIDESLPLISLSTIGDPSELSKIQIKMKIIEIVNELSELIPSLSQNIMNTGDLLNLLKNTIDKTKVEDIYENLFKGIDITKSIVHSLGEMIKISSYEDLLIQKTSPLRLSLTHSEEECVIEGLAIGWLDFDEALYRLKLIYEKKTHYFESKEFEIYDEGIFFLQQMESSGDRKPEKSFIKDNYLHVQSLFHGVILENMQKVLINIIEVELEGEQENVLELLKKMDNYLEINSTFFLNIIGVNFQITKNEKLFLIINVFYEPFNIPLGDYPYIEVELKENDSNNNEQKKLQLLKWFYSLMIEIGAFFNSGRLLTHLTISNICLTLKHYPVIIDPSFEVILPVSNTKSKLISSKTLEILKDIAGEYLAPELKKAEKEMSEGEITQTTVIWDLGLILYKILDNDFGRGLVSTTSLDKAEVTNNINDQINDLLKKNNKDETLISILKQMLDPNPQERIKKGVEYYIKLFEGILKPTPTRPDTGWLFLAEYLNCSFEEEIPKSEKRIFLRGRKLFRGAFTDNYPNGHGCVEIKDHISYEGLLEQNSLSGNGVFRKKEYGIEYEFDGVFSFNLPGKGTLRRSFEAGRNWKVVSSREFISEAEKKNPEFDGFEYMKRLPIPQYQLYLKKLISKCDSSDQNSRLTYELIEKYMKKFEVFDLRQPIKIFDSESNFLVSPEDFKKFLIRKIDNLSFYFMFYCEEIEEKKILYCDTFGFGLFDLINKPEPLKFPTEIVITKLRGFKYSFEGFKRVGRFLGGKFVSGLLTYFNENQLIVKKLITEKTHPGHNFSTFYDIPKQRVYKSFIFEGEPDFYGEQYLLEPDGQFKDLIYRGGLQQRQYHGRGCLFKKNRVIFSGFFAKGLPITGKYITKGSKKKSDEIITKEKPLEIEGVWTPINPNCIPAEWVSASEFLRAFTVKGYSKTKDSIIIKRFGDFEIKDDLQKLKGYFKFFFKNGNTYEGEVDDGTKNGKGSYIIKKPNGSEVKIEGIWTSIRESKNKDKFVCKVKGAIYWEKDNVYEKTVGYFSFTDAGECTMEGFGLLFFRKGIKYIGMLSDNKMTRGIMKYPSKIDKEVYEKIYTGTFSEGKKDGFGELIEFLIKEDKSLKYVGMWKDNKRDGFGIIYEESTFTKKPIKLYEGIFEKDILSKGTKFYHESSPILCIIATSFSKNEDKNFSPRIPAKIIIKQADEDLNNRFSTFFIECCDQNLLDEIDSQAMNNLELNKILLRGVKLTRKNFKTNQDLTSAVYNIEKEWVEKADEVFVGEMKEAGKKELTGYNLWACQPKSSLKVFPEDTLTRILFRNYSLVGNSYPEIKMYMVRLQGGKERWERRKKKTFALEVDVKNRTQWVGYFKGNEKIDGFWKGVGDVFNYQCNGATGSKNTVLLELNSKPNRERTIYQLLK